MITLARKTYNNKNIFSGMLVVESISNSNVKEEMKPGRTIIKALYININKEATLKCPAFGSTCAFVVDLILMLVDCFRK